MSLNGVKAAKAPTSSSNSLALAFILLLSSSCIIVSAETETFAGTAASDSTALQVAGKADEKAAAAAAQTDADEALFSDNSAGSQMVKRAAARTYNFGLGKRGNSDISWDRWSPNDLLFTKDKLIDFILRQNQQNNVPANYYSNPNSYADNYALQSVYVPESLGIKRSKPQRFSFGLGKRMQEAAGPTPQEHELEEEKVESYAEEDNASGRNKRKAERYQFGLGKRSPFAWFGISGGPKSARNIDEFKRRYNFGLGK